MKYFFLSLITLFFAVSSISAQKQIHGFVCIDDFGGGDDSCEACLLKIQPPKVGLQSPDGMTIIFSSGTSQGGSGVDCSRVDSHYTYGDGTSGTSGIHTYSAPGIYTVCHVVTVQFEGMEPCTDQACSEICVGPNCRNVSNKTVLTGNSTSIANISVYPNPARDIINVELEENIEFGNITIMNASGMVLKSISINDSNMMIDISELPTGTYLLKTEDAEGKLILKRFVKSE